MTLLYGTRRFGSQTCEIILADAGQADQDKLNLFKFDLLGSASGWTAHATIATPSTTCTWHWRGRCWPQLQPRGGLAGLDGNQKYLIGHEWLAMPLLLAAQIDEPGQWRTILYAHETATVRRLVEERPGHDTSFYNAMFKAKEWNLSLEAIYGNQDHDHKHPLLRLATRCDAIFAVGDVIVDELRFLGGRFANSKIEVVYNGSSAEQITLADKQASKARLQQYAERLLGYRPDYVFTHVSDAWCCQRRSGATCGCSSTWRRAWPSEDRRQCCLCWRAACRRDAGRSGCTAGKSSTAGPWCISDDNGDLAGLERYVLLREPRAVQPAPASDPRRSGQPVRLEPRTLRRAHALRDALCRHPARH